MALRRKICGVWCNFPSRFPMRQLSWTHFLLLIPIKSEAARMYYAQQSAAGRWSVRELRRAIFKDPYFPDFLGLRDGYGEADLEGAILVQLKSFILELGTGFAFVERKNPSRGGGADRFDLVRRVQSRASRAAAGA